MSASGLPLASPDLVPRMRAFNRFYTARLGVVGGDSYLDSGASLAEGRVLFEIAHNENITAAGIAGALKLDAGYVSRVVGKLERNGLLERRPSATDSRARNLSLTDRGRDKLAALNGKSDSQAAALLAALPLDDQREAVAAMDRLRVLLGDGEGSVVLRTHGPGDIGWIIARQAILYGREYDFGGGFEALLTEICMNFLRSFDPRRERCWIAEVDGRPAGTVMLVHDRDDVGRLRLLHVEPWARGAGLGRRLVAECIRFARECGYRTLTLWTHAILTDAIRIYERAGFELISSHTHDDFGRPVVSQTWNLRL